MRDDLINVATRNWTSEVQATVVNIPAIDPSLCGATTRWLLTSADLPEFTPPAAGGPPAADGLTSQQPIVVDGGDGAAASSSSQTAPATTPTVPAPKPDDDAEKKVKQASTNASGIIQPAKAVVKEAMARHDRGESVSLAEWKVPALPSDHHHDHLQHHQHQRAPPNVLLPPMPPPMPPPRNHRSTPRRSRPSSSRPSAGGRRRVRSGLLKASSPARLAPERRRRSTS